MHELFLTATVSAADFEQATAVLQGLCAMAPWQSRHRILYFNGPPQAKGLANSRSVLPSPYGKWWAELSQQLGRQSYILQARYEVFKDRDFGVEAGGSADSLNAAQGTLRWTDLPDPTGNRPVTQRKKVEIPDQKNLLTILADNKHKFKSEAVEESYSFFRDNIEYTLTRYLQLPPGATSGTGPLPLPAWDALTPVDPAGKWVLWVRTHVVEDTTPEKMHRALDELVAVRDGELHGVFDFKVLDRRAYDTRVSQVPISTTPVPLPQTVRAGIL